MHILVISDRFIPEITAPSFRVMDHARIWVKKGHEVTVVTCVPNFPAGKVFPGYKHKLYQVEYIEGIRVIRVWSYMTANEGFVKRTLDFISFMVSAWLFCFRYPKFDVILATSPPLFVALSGYLVSVFRRRPWVFEVRDLWPASIRAVGASSNSRVLDFFEKLELFLYRNAQRIVLLTHSFKADLIARKVPGEKCDVVLNGVDTEQFNRSRATIDARKELGLDASTFLAAYIGTTGMAHGLETVIKAAELCKDEPAIRVLIMGQGASRAGLEQLVKEKGLTNVLFKDFVAHDQVPSYLAALDVSIVHLKPDPVFKTVIPSKIFENMAMGVPMLYAVEGESAEIVKESGAGICIPSGDAELMASTLRQMYKDRATLKAMGERGVAAVREVHGREARADQIIVSLQAAIDGWKKKR